MPDGSSKNQGQGNLGHSPEVLHETRPDTGLLAFREAAERLGKNPNAHYMAEMAKMSAEAPPEKQEEGLVFLEKNLIDIVANNPDVKAENLELREFLYQVKIVKNTEQTIALQKARELLSDPANPNARQLLALWPAIRQNGIDARGGFGAKYMKRLKEKPVETVVITMAAAAGIYLGLKAIKWLIGKSWEKTKKEAKEKIGDIFSPFNILSALGIGAAGLYMGRQKFENWIYETFGVRFAKGKTEEMLDKIKNGQMPKELEDLKMGLTPKGVIEKTKEKIAEVKEATKKGLEAHETHKKYVDFIKKQNPELNVSALLFPHVADMPYEQFMNYKEENIGKTAYELYMKILGNKKEIPKITELKASDIEEIFKTIENFGVADLYEFFSEMLIDPHHPDFEGKTVKQVMAMITDPKNEGKYINQEKVKEINKKPEYYKKVNDMITQIKNDPANILREEFRTEFYAVLAKAGMMIVFNRTGEALLFVAKTFTPIAIFTGNEVTAALHKMAELTEEEVGGATGYTMGSYLKAAGYVAWIGVPAGASIGLAKGMIKNPINPIYWAISSAKGAGQGLKISMKWPVYPYQAIVNYFGANVTPLDTLKIGYYEQIFYLDEIKKYKFLGVGKVAESIFGESYVERISEGLKNGAIKPTKSIMMRLSVYKNMLEKENERLRKHPSFFKKGLYGKKILRNQGQIEKIREIEKKYPQLAEIGKFETVRYKTSENLFTGSREELQSKLTALEENASKLSGAEKVAAQQEIHALDSFLTPRKQPALTGYEQLATTEEKVGRLNEFAAEIEARSAGVDAYVKKEVQAIQELAKEQKLSLAHPDIQREFTELDKFTESYTKERAAALNDLSKKYKGLPKNLRTPELKARLKFAFEGPEGTFLTKLKIAGKKALIGRATVGAIIASGIFAIEYFTNKDPKKDLFDMLEEFGPTAGQIFVDILPFVGTGSMLYGAIGGKESVTGAKLDTTGRLITGAFGVSSLALDALTVLSGGVGGVPATAGRLAVLAKKGGKASEAATMLLKNWSRISSLMTRMGLRKFGEGVLAFMKGERVAKGIRVVEKGAAITGGAIMAGSIVYSFVGGHEVDIPEDIDIGSKPSQAENAKEDAAQKEPESEPAMAAAS